MEPRKRGRNALLHENFLIRKGENTRVARSVLHTSFDRAIKRFMLTYQMPIDIAGLSQLARPVHNQHHESPIWRAV